RSSSACPTSGSASVTTRAPAPRRTSTARSWRSARSRRWSASIEASTQCWTSDQMNCVHGLDARFCAVCTRTAIPRRGSLASVTLEEILRFLNDTKVRATYGAVAEVLGVVPRSMSARLGPHRPEASWIVSGENGLPTDYSEDEWHPELLSRGEI